MSRWKNLVPSQDDIATATVDESPVDGAGDEIYETSEEQVYEEQTWEDEPAKPRGIWIAPALTAIAAIGWTGFFGLGSSPANAGRGNARPVD